MVDLDKQTEQAKEALRKAVIKALDRKRRLGQYAVIYKNGKIVRIEADQTSEQEKPA